MKPTIIQIGTARFRSDLITSYQTGQYVHDTYGPITRWPARWFNDTEKTGTETTYTLWIACGGQVAMLTSTKSDEMAAWVTAAEAALQATLDI